MIHKDDLPPDVDLVWVYQTVRFLVPRKLESWSTGVLVNESYDTSTTSSFMAGKAKECPDCGWVGVDTRGFPWGAQHHKQDFRAESVVPEFYCPKCDGAEDV